jgi:pyruvate formate lyase activating enzyme
MTVREVFDLVKRDRVFYENSGGGLTLGGGEASAQPEFARALLKKCQQNGIHTAMETCGFAKPESFASIIRHVDLLLFDLKHLDSAAHRDKTGVPNTQILENAQRASNMVPEMIARLALIPGFNDSDENIEATGTFIRDQLPRVERIDVLPYHSVGESKMTAIGGTYRYNTDGELTDQRLDQVKQMLSSYGLLVRIGG